MVKYKTLIIEDNWKNRKDYYLNVFKEYFEIDPVQVASDLMDKMNNIRSYDLVVVDIVLSNFKWPNKKPIHLFEVLEMIGRHKPIVLVSSEFGKLGENGELPDILSVLTKKGYNLVDFIDWQEFQNEGKDDKITSTRSKIKFSLDTFYRNNHKNPVHVAIVSALPMEISPIEKRLSIGEPKSNSPYEFKFGGLINDSGNFIECLTSNQMEMGMVDASYLCQKIISYYKPRLIVMIGVCGGREGEVNIGDIIVPKKIITYQRGKLNDSTLSLEVDSVDVNDTLIDKLKGKLFSHTIPSRIYADWRESNPTEYKTPDGGVKQYFIPKLNRETLACGEVVINRKGELDKIATDTGQRKLSGVDMESYAVVRAEKANPEIEITSLVIKSVMDLTHDKNDLHKRYAAFNSSMFLFHFLKESKYINDILFNENVP